jgi:hypothetical protein
MAAFYEGAKEDVTEGRVVFDDQQFQRSFSRHVSKGNYTHAGSGLP